MGSKVHKGQEVVVPGSLVGETIVTKKIDYDSVCNPIYIADVKVGIPDCENRHFIKFLTFDSSCNLTKVETALNKTRIGDACDSITVTLDVTSDVKFIGITVTGGDFSEIKIGDSIQVTTISNTVGAAIIQRKPSDCTVQVLAQVGITNECATSVNACAVIAVLNHTSTKEFEKRRYDHRTRYFYG